MYIVKAKSVLLMAVFSVIFWGCKKTGEESHSAEDMVSESTQATLYYHAIFREAENAWAQMDDLGYPVTEIVKTSGSSYKKMVFSTNSTNYAIAIEYNNWTSGPVRLSGTMRVTLANINTYHVKDFQARVDLTGFAVNDQRVTGAIAMKYITDPAVETETSLHTYTYSLSDNGIIYNLEDANKPDISASVTDGVYTQVEGGNTMADASDDIWAFTGTTKGQLYAGAEYTHTVVKSETTDGTLFLNAGCNKALRGVCLLDVDGYPEMYYDYGSDCASSIEIKTVEDLDI